MHLRLQWATEEVETLSQNDVFRYLTSRSILFLLYLSIATRAVIGQFYYTARYAAFVAKMFRDLSPSVLNFYSK